MGGFGDWSVEGVVVPWDGFFRRRYDCTFCERVLYVVGGCGCSEGEAKHADEDDQAGVQVQHDVFHGVVSKMVVA